MVGGEGGTGEGLSERRAGSVVGDDLAVEPHVVPGGADQDVVAGAAEGDAAAAAQSSQVMPYCLEARA